MGSLQLTGVDWVDMRLGTVTTLVLVLLGLVVQVLMSPPVGLEAIAAHQAEAEMSLREETVETGADCGCKCGCQVPAQFILSQVMSPPAQDSGDMQLPVDCGCDCACQ